PRRSATKSSAKSPARCASSMPKNCWCWRRRKWSRGCWKKNRPRSPSWKPSSGNRSVSSPRSSTGRSSSMSCCSDLFLHDAERRSTGRAGGNPPSAWLAGFAALLPPYTLVCGYTRRFVGWAERSEAQPAREASNDALAPSPAPRALRADRARCGTADCRGGRDGAGPNPVAAGNELSEFHRAPVVRAAAPPGEVRDRREPLAALGSVADREGLDAGFPPTGRQVNHVAAGPVEIRFQRVAASCASLADVAAQRHRVARRTFGVRLAGGRVRQFVRRNARAIAIAAGGPGPERRARGHRG